MATEGQGQNFFHGWNLTSIGSLVYSGKGRIVELRDSTPETPPLPYRTKLTLEGRGEELATQITES